MHDIQFFHISPSRSSIVHWMLEELGEPFDVHLLNYKEGENRKEEFLKINPMGKVPTITFKGEVITEAAAICLFLADQFPQKKLNIPIGQSERGSFLRWLFFGPSCIEPALIAKASEHEEMPVGTAGWGNYQLVIDVLESHLKDRKFVVGDRFTAADVIVGSQIHWGQMYELIPKGGVLEDYTKAMTDRPAHQRASAKDMEWAPQSNPR